MTTAAVLMPTGITDDWREKARTFVAGWYAHYFPEIPVVFGECSSAEWSKGAAVADAFDRAPAGAQVLVIADADSYLADPATLRKALQLVSSGTPWITAHSRVYRLRDVETARLHAAGPTERPRLGWLVRPVYEGPHGGGITILSRQAFELVGGIDRRFAGWGGEDLAFGWALQTLAGEVERLDGRLVHLWHPHPAPTLRGSPESEALLELYRQARGVRRRMLAVLAGEQWTPATPLPDPVRFRMTPNRKILRLPSGEAIRFSAGIYETTDPDEVEQLRRFRIVREERRR